jgi:hypothetical protein
MLWQARYEKADSSETIVGKRLLSATEKGRNRSNHKQPCGFELPISDL